MLSPAASSHETGDGALESQTQPAVDIAPIAAAAPAALPNPREVAVTLRTTLGLRADERILAELEADKVSVGRSQALGIPLAESEAALLQTRFEAFRKNEIVSKEVLTAVGEGNYGGSWYDQVRGIEVIAVLSPAVEVATKIASLAPVPTRLEVKTVTHASSTLDAALAAVATIHPNGYADIKNNRVVIVATTEQAPTAGLIHEKVGYPASLFSVEVNNDKPRDHSAALGGQEVTGCSTGAHGYVWYLGLQVPFLVTAGHCGDTLFHVPQHGVAFLRANESQSGTADAQSMYHGTSQNPLWQPTSKVEGWALPNDLTLTSAAPAGGGADKVGAIVCQAGSTTQGAPGNCGDITSVNVVCNGYTGLRGSNAFNNPGDSGGTVYGFTYSYSVPLAGMVKGVCAGKFVHSFQGNVRVVLGLAGWYLN